MKKSAFRYLLPLNLFLVFLFIVSPADTYAQEVDSPWRADTPPAAPLAQQLRFEHLTIEEGLSNNWVVNMLLDSKFFILFGNFDGLNHYDGYESQVFQHNLEDQNNLDPDSNTPPWWETTWFRGGMILLLVGIVAGVLIWHLGLRQAREQELEALITAGTQELQFAQAQIGALFKNSPLAIGTASIKGEILTANDAMARIFGYSKDELIGVNVTDFFPDPEQRSELMKKLMEEKTIQVPVIQLRRRDGSMFYANLTESILTRDDQDVLLGVVNDITRQVLAEQALKEKAEVSAIADERNRLARELHDSVTQSLYTTSLLAEALPEVWESHPEEARQSLKEIRRINQGALAEMRTLLLELRPGAIAILPLGDLLRQLTDALSARSNLPIVISTMGECKLSAEVQVSFYRIAQEALNNIVKHARATKAWVNLRCSADEITLRIRDNGRGYDTQIEAPHNLGLKIMRERAQDIDAELIVTSQPDKGTEIRVQWRRS